MTAFDHITQEKVDAVLSQFRGEIEQTPPMCVHRSMYPKPCLTRIYFGQILGVKNGWETAMFVCSEPSHSLKQSSLTVTIVQTNMLGVAYHFLVLFPRDSVPFLLSLYLRSLKDQRIRISIRNWRSGKQKRRR